MTSESQEKSAKIASQYLLESVIPKAVTRVKGLPAVKTQIATTVDPDLLAGLSELAEVEETSVARILRRGARRELEDHRRSHQRLVNGKTRTEHASGKRKRNRAKVAAAA